MKEYFDKWLFAKKNGGLRSIEKESIIIVLNSIEKYKDKLEKYFKEEIKIINLNKNISKNYEFKKEQEKLEIKDINDYNDFCVSINRNKIFITLLR